MASWLKIIQEAKSILDREIKNWKQEEEEYNRAKRRAKGLYVPPSKSRQDFLDRFNRWLFTVNIDEPELNEGQARRKGKEAFFNNESGAPLFFSPQKTLKIYNIKVDKEENGYMVYIEFGAEFKKVGGKRIEPSEGELEKYGFSPVKYNEEPKQREKFILTLRTPHREGINNQNVLKMVAPALKAQSTRFLKDAKLLGAHKIELEGDEWVVQFKIEGIPLLDYMDSSEMGDIDVFPTY